VTLRIADWGLRIRLNQSAIRIPQSAMSCGAGVISFLHVVSGAA